GLVDPDLSPERQPRGCGSKAKRFRDMVCRALQELRPRQPANGGRTRSEIGRASCRERAESSGGAVTVEKREKRWSGRRRRGTEVRQHAVSFFFFQAEDGIRDWSVTGVQTCALPI